MKNLVLRWVVLLGLLVPAARALPPVSHALKGVVQSVEVEKHLVVVQPDTKEGPMELIVVEGRSHLERNRKEAGLADLKVGDAVKLYYKEEGVKRVVVELTWEAVGPKDG